MEKVLAALELLTVAANTAAAAADAAAKAKKVFDIVTEQAQRTNELTPEQVQAIRDRADVIFASEASKPSGR